MTINEVKKKIKKLKDLVSEYGTIDATIKFMEKDREAEGTYLQNLKRRRENIMLQFDTILKK